jgi:Tfp pilus assembly protein PilE
MLDRAGMTLMEISIIMIIVAIAVVFAFPSYTVPMEQARSMAAQNNLLAIYAAQKNYINERNNSNYCTTNVPNPQTALCASWGVNPANQCGQDLVDLNCNLNMNIQDDNNYSYACTNNGANYFTCTATRTPANTASTLTITLTNATPVNLRLGSGNPTCTSSTGNANWCP